MTVSTPQPVTLRGTVIHGDGRGRELGFPTANLRLSEDELPSDGIYAATASVRGRSEEFLAVVSVGSNPTFPGVRGRRVEVHLLDADLDLYGEQMVVELHRMLRDTVVFTDEAELIEQSAADVRRCRALLGAQR